MDDLIERRARKLWDERERRFPPSTRQSFDQGTDLARSIMLAQAKREIDAERIERLSEGRARRETPNG